MSEETPKQTDAAPDGDVVEAAFTPLLGCRARAVRSWIEANSALLTDGVGVEEQMAEFSHGPISLNRDLWQTLSGCGNMSELLASEMKNVGRATSDYVGKAKVLAGRLIGVVNAADGRSQEPAAKP